MDTQLISSTIRTAIDVRDALREAAQYLKPIGYCPDLTREWKESFSVDVNKRDETPEAIEKLRDLDANANVAYLRGDLDDDDFQLTITREGCEYSGAPGRLAKFDMFELLKNMYNCGDVAGYGDVRSQETKVDKSVRNAKEIPSHHFRVSDTAISKLEAECSKYFIPSNIRLEPYKINIYGPGGLFKPHRDTPELGLVGTLVLCIGNYVSRNDTGGLYIPGYGDNSEFLDITGAWVAFYPDVVHEVCPTQTGFRASIVFKVFRKEQDPEKVAAEDTEKRTELTERMKSIFADFPLDNYGLLLKHKYALGTETFSGFDNILLEYLRSQPATVADCLPVLVDLHASHDYVEYGDDPVECSSKVYPLTSNHINFVLASKGRSRNVDESFVRSHWSKGLNIPFFKLEHSCFTWNKKIEEGSEHIGNESRPDREDSIYLSYAVVIRKDTEQPEGTTKPQEAQVDNKEV